MNNHDTLKELENTRVLVEKISPEFSELTVDLEEVMKKSSDPVFLSALLFKLTEERRKTNKLLEEIGRKYDDIMFELKIGQTGSGPHQTSLAETGKKDFSVLPEQDQLILKHIEEHGSVTAKDIRTILNYRGLNAASQRLNKLYKEDYLKKIHAGKKVEYLIKS